MSTESLRLGVASGVGPGVHSRRLADDEAIGNQLADSLAGVGVGDLGGLVGIEPDLALSASDDGRREALLGATKVGPRKHICQPK